jgi:hypothetical protein
MPIADSVHVMGRRVWKYEATVYLCPHCSAVLSIEKSAEQK